MQTLKEEVNRLLAAQGQPARYTGPRLSATPATAELPAEGSQEGGEGGPSATVKEIEP